MRVERNPFDYSEDVIYIIQYKFRNEWRSVETPFFDYESANSHMEGFKSGKIRFLYVTDEFRIVKRIIQRSYYVVTED